MRLSRVVGFIIVINLFFVSIANATIYGAISGTVMLTSTNTGVAGLEVFATDVLNNDKYYYTTTDNSGKFVIQNVAAGSTYKINIDSTKNYYWDRAGLENLDSCISDKAALN